MVANPCCMPLKVGVKIITHLSMALAVAVGFMGVRLISISLEVTANPTFHQEHLSSSLPLQNERGLGWKSDPMMKGSLQGVIYPEDESYPTTTGGSDGIAAFSSNHNLRSALVSRDFMLKYSQAMLVCGLMAVCAAAFQFLCSCFLLCFINWEEKAVSQIWVAVNMSILFCLGICLVVLLCEGKSVPFYSQDGSYSGSETSALGFNAGILQPGNKYTPLADHTSSKSDSYSTGKKPPSTFANSGVEQSDQYGIKGNVSAGYSGGDGGAYSKSQSEQYAIDLGFGGAVILSNLRVPPKSKEAPQPEKAAPNRSDHANPSSTPPNRLFLN